MIPRRSQVTVSAAELTRLAAVHNVKISTHGATERSITVDGIVYITDEAEHSTGRWSA